MEYPIISFPPGYRFCPTDEELVIHYLVKKAKNLPVSNFTVKECDLYGATEPWEIWKSFGGHKRVSEIDKDEGLFFFTRLKKRSPKDSRFSRAVGSGLWHEDSATGILSSDEKKLPIGRKRKFIYKNKKSAHNGRWLMHEISLLDQSIDLVLCLLRKNDKRKLSEFETEQEAISNDNGASVRKRQRLISRKSQEGEPTVLNNSQTLKTWEAEAISDCNDTSLEQAVLAVPDLADDSGDLVDEIMDLLNKEESPNDETDTSAAVETNSLNAIEDRTEVIISHMLPPTTEQSQPVLSSESLSFFYSSKFSSVDEVLEYFDCEKSPESAVEDQLVPSEEQAPEISLTSQASLAFSMSSNYVEALDSADQDQLVLSEEQPEISLMSQTSLAFNMSSNYVEAAEEQCDSESISSHRTTPQFPLLSCSPGPSLPVGSCDTDADYSTIDWTQHFAHDPEYEPPYLLQENESMLSGSYNRISCVDY